MRRWKILKKELKEKEENDKVPAPPIKVEPKVELEPDFDKHYEVFKNPANEEKGVKRKDVRMGQFTSLIKEKRSALVKQLVVQMSVDPAVTGKSTIFKTPSKEFAEDIEGRILLQLVRPWTGWRGILS